MTPRFALLSAAVLAVFSALILLTDDKIHAQTDTLASLAAPALTAQATASGVVLSWEGVAGAVRYELLTWWANDPGWQALGGTI